MPAPSLMYEHALDAVKGWPSPTALDFSAKLSANVSATVYEGMVVHLNTSGEFELGVSGSKMPMFIRQGVDALDAANPGTTPAGNFMHRSVAPAGNYSALVATGGYELESTEYDLDPAAAYAPNQLLTALASNSTAAGGRLSNERNGASAGGGLVRAGADPVCGVVSRGYRKNAHGVGVLTFWPVYVPVTNSTG